MFMGQSQNSWLTRRVQGAIQLGLRGAYSGVQVDPVKYLLHLRRAYGLPIASFREMHAVPLSVVDYLAEKTISTSRKVALAEGAGLGLGGIMTILPDVGLLSTITFRMIQRLSLIHGFEYSSNDEVAELWLATASAAGVDIGKDWLEKQVVERFVPRVVERIACRAGAEVAEKWVARAVPLVSSVLGGTLNYYFIRGWGNRARRHFRERYLLTRNPSVPIEHNPLVLRKKSAPSLAEVAPPL